MPLKNTKSEGIYVSILGKDGSFRVASDKEEEGVVKRDFESSDGKKGTKYEFIYTELSGRISEISFKDTNFGRMLNIFIGDGKDKFILSTNSENNFAIDLMKKLPNLNFSKDITFAPYSFEDDKGKTKKGVTVKQNNEKIINFFYDIEKKVNLYDFPEVNEDKKPEASQKAKWKKFWKSYFSDIEDYLVEYTEKNIIPKIEKINEKNTAKLKTSKEVKDEVEEKDPFDDL